MNRWESTYYGKHRIFGTFDSNIIEGREMAMLELHYDPQSVYFGGQTKKFTFMLARNKDTCYGVTTPFSSQRIVVIIPLKENETSTYYSESPYDNGIMYFSKDIIEQILAQIPDTGASCPSLPSYRICSIL